MKKFITCLLATIGLTTACGQHNYEDVDVQAFKSLTEEQDIILLDVRTAEEFAEGHIEGAINIDQGQDSFIETAKAALPVDKNYRHLLPQRTSFCECCRTIGGRGLQVREPERRHRRLEGCWYERDHRHYERT